MCRLAERKAASAALLGFVMAGFIASFLRSRSCTSPHILGVVSASPVSNSSPGSSTSSTPSKPSSVMPKAWKLKSTFDLVPACCDSRCDHAPVAFGLCQRREFPSEVDEPMTCTVFDIPPVAGMSASVLAPPITTLEVEGVVSGTEWFAPSAECELVKVCDQDVVEGGIAEMRFELSPVAFEIVVANLTVFVSRSVTVDAEMLWIGHREASSWVLSVDAKKAPTALGASPGLTFDL